MSAALSAADVIFINRVASRKFAAGEPAAVDGAAIDAAITAAQGGSAHSRAARLAAGLLRGNATPTAPLHTALLVIHCSLSLDGLSLLAPQGVLAGMVRLLQEGDVGTVEHWLEDRSVPSASSG